MIANQMAPIMEDKERANRLDLEDIPDLGKRLSLRPHSPHHCRDPKKSTKKIPIRKPERNSNSRGFPLPVKVTF